MPAPVKIQRPTRSGFHGWWPTLITLTPSYYRHWDTGEVPLLSEPTFDEMEFVPAAVLEQHNQSEILVEKGEMEEKDEGVSSSSRSWSGGWWTFVIAVYVG